MPETGPEPARTSAVPLPPDRERDAGFRGDAWMRVSVLLGLVFAAGLVFVAAVAWSRRRRPPRG